MQFRSKLCSIMASFQYQIQRFSSTYVFNVYNSVLQETKYEIRSHYSISTMLLLLLLLISAFFISLQRKQGYLYY